VTGTGAVRAASSSTPLDRRGEAPPWRCAIGEEPEEPRDGDGSRRGDEREEGKIGRMVCWPNKCKQWEEKFVGQQK
jgi:hypothetical protein